MSLDLLPVQARQTALPLPYGGIAAIPSFRSPRLSLIVPTFNERDNVRELAERLSRTLEGLDWEVVFVDDDSPDGTIDVLRAMARRDSRVRFIHRIGRRGLSSAVVEGAQSTSAPFIGVMDCDMQHDETLLPRMYERLRSSNLDLVVGSRYLHTDGLEGLDKRRRFFSAAATRLAQSLFRVALTDPMSGFFMLSRAAFDRCVRDLSSLGYKILLDIVISAPTDLKFAELPYVFRTRTHGASKLDSAVTWEYFMLLADKLVGRFVPIRFLVFILVGGFGVCVHMTVLALLKEVFGLSFVAGQTLAATSAMTFNFFANNALTYRDKRLRGRRQLLVGLLSFYAVCMIGTVSNVGIASLLFVRAYSWWLSGLAGILVGAVWNFSASSIFTWRK
jgi:dolichol-phosphate mannosyltransferase